MINFPQITFLAYHPHAQVPLIVPLCLRITFQLFYQVFKDLQNVIATKFIWLKLRNNQSRFFYPMNMPYLSVCLCLFSHSWNVCPTLYYLFKSYSFFQSTVQ